MQLVINSCTEVQLVQSVHAQASMQHGYQVQTNDSQYFQPWYLLRQDSYPESFRQT